MPRIFCMCLNDLSVYTGDRNIFHDKSLYPFHSEQAPELISFTFDHPVFVLKKIIGMHAPTCAHVVLVPFKKTFPTLIIYYVNPISTYNKVLYVLENTHCGSPRSPFWIIRYKFFFFLVFLLLFSQWFFV